MVTGQQKTDELLQDFMRPTEPKDHTAEPDAEKTAPVASQPLELDAEEVPGTGGKPSAAKERLMGAEFVSEAFIGMFDTTQSLILTKINQKKMKRRLGDKLPKAEQLFAEIESGRIQMADLSPEDYAIFLRIKDLMKIEEEIPLTDEEYEKLKVPLLKLVEINNIDIPPGLALMMSVVEVMAPRIVDVIFE